MKKFLILIAAVFAFLTSCDKKVVEMSEFPVDLLNEMKDVQSISYDVEYKMRYLGEPDTTIRNGRCTLIKVPSDTLFGGMIWLEVNDSLSKYYDLSYIYEINHNNKTVTRYDALNGEDWALTGDVFGDLIDFDFLENYESFSNIMKNESTEKILKDTTFNNAEFVNCVLKYEDSEEIKNSKIKIYVNKDLKVIQETTTSLFYMDDLQYSSQIKTNIKRNSFTPKMMEMEFRNYNDYKTTDYVKPESEPLLDTNTIAPNFTGYYYPDSTKFELSDFRGKTVLLDFFYINCYYCIQAIPHLSELYDKYKDKDVVVLGINPFDNKENSLRRLPKFIKINNMNYPIIFIEPEISKLYNVSGYPTMYVIDKDGKIKYRSAGWGDGLEEAFEFEIKKLIE